MGPGAEPEFPVPGAGLCARCAHARVVRSGRGSEFVMCGRAAKEPGFPKYPRLPVVACRGFEPPPPGEKGIP